MTTYVFVNKGYIKIEESLCENEKLNQILNTYLSKFKHKKIKFSTITIFITYEKEKEEAISLIRALEVNGFEIKIFGGNLNELKIVKGYVEDVKPGRKRFVIVVKLFGRLTPKKFTIYNSEDYRKFLEYVEENHICIPHEYLYKIETYVSLLEKRGYIPSEYKSI